MALVAGAGLCGCTLRHLLVGGYQGGAMLCNFPAYAILIRPEIRGSVQ